MGLLCANSAYLWDYCVLTLLTYKCIVCERCLPANVLCANVAYLQINYVLTLLTYKYIVFQRY